ncbi:hypothetical protein N7495_004474 [Penicillium taxi]|uniref:uncharacterized protein n=1 Tax=Penicillium taxi TaxID=168475 RepID=UPI0025451A34|nr:uncharacterized protein N7495_004474 [Penicillium taxi]KAJ5899730.1 hypothetical protein N7495_004474 [Penicillium taxi]
MEHLNITDPHVHSPFYFTTSVNDFDTIEDFEAKVLCLAGTKKPGDFSYTEVPPSWAIRVFKALDEEYPHRKTWNSKDLVLRLKMPVRVHDCHQAWISGEMQEWRTVPGLWSQADNRLCGLGVGTTIDYTTGPLSGSKKEPDLLFCVNSLPYPTFAIESGWSESAPALMRDKDLLLNAAQGETSVVIIIKWKKNVHNQVSAGLKVFRWGQPIPTEVMTIFPRPANSSQQVINLTRREVMGQALPWGSNPNDILPLHVDELRSRAVYYLNIMGLTHA